MVNEIRERVLPQCRILTRTCALCIRAVHRHRFDEAVALMDEARRQADRIRQDTAAHPDLFAAGYTQDALKELVEASLLMAFVMESGIPRPEGLHVPPATYLGGMAEAGTELRRYVLDLLRRDQIAQAERCLQIMDEIYDLLNQVDLPAAITHQLRRQTDVVRGVLERTRSDVTAAKLQGRLRTAIETLHTQWPPSLS